ncbi:MAG: thioester domain-containing protein, partial [Clostridium sp.]
MKISKFKSFFKRKKERRKGFLRKKLVLLLVGLLSYNTIGSVIANAAVGNTGVGISLITGGDGTPVIAPPITIDGEVAYCLNLYKKFPVATTYGEGVPYQDNRIRSILYHGYPVDASGLQEKYGISGEHARYYTQVAIWQITGDLISRNYGIGYIDELLQLGRNGTLPNTFFEVSPNSLNAVQKEGYQETQVITTKGSKGTFTFPSDNNIWSVDSNGNKKNTFNIGETFKIRGKQGFSGEKRVGLKSSLTKPASLKYDGGNGYQDVVKYYSDPIQRNDDLSVKFNGTGKIVLTKTDDLGNVLPGV